MSDQMSNQIMSARFQYKGQVRHLDNYREVIAADGTRLLLGFEWRKSGMYSQAVKSFKVEEMQNLEFIAIADRENRP